MQIAKRVCTSQILIRISFSAAPWLAQLKLIDTEIWWLWLILPSSNYVSPIIGLFVILSYEMLDALSQRKASFYYELATGKLSHFFGQSEESSFKNKTVFSSLNEITRKNYGPNTYNARLSTVRKQFLKMRKRRISISSTKVFHIKQNMHSHKTDI